jgi:chromosome partitioning protein
VIISLLNQKGGTGKTTLAVNLARCLTLNNESTLLVDSDPQGSARDWHVKSNGDLVEVVGLDRPTIDKDINKFKPHYKWIIIDGAPRLDDMAVKTVICSDVILIPVQPSPYDIQATASIVELVKARQDITNGKLKAAFIVSRQICNTVIGKQIREILEQFELPIFNCGTFQRIVYVMTANGETVFDSCASLDAKKEIEDITTELKEFVLKEFAQ